ncbi:MAG: ABC transporter permease, partial [Burkholderiaceae bacterium]|nr:ABC transporter permease [Burkholderiaceae bacterium]
MSALDSSATVIGTRVDPGERAGTTAAPAGRRAPRWLGALLPLAVLALLEISVQLGAVPAHLLPPPTEIARTLVELTRNGLGAHLLASTLRVA